MGAPSGAGALVGTRLGNYELVALLALGGTAEIYLARIGGTAGFEKYVVVKCLHDHLAYDREFVQMFLDEARLGAQLGHSNIVQTLGLGEHDGRYYMVMEHIAGMSIALMARRATERVSGGRIPVPLVLGAAIQACGGLHYAHEATSSGRPLNLIHRDVSPQNLVVTFEGVVKIVDFGIAKAEERETATRSGTIKGKFAYMSPEQCQARDIDRRTDVFALGTVLHELLTGRRLFKRNSTYDTYQAILECKVPAPSAVNHELDPALDAVVMKALVKNPAGRYPTAEAFGEAMSNYLHSRGKAGGGNDIAGFIEQHYGPEIEDHGARMRELLAGRPASALGWNDPDEPQSASAVELSQFEVIEDLDVRGHGAAEAMETVDFDPRGKGADAGGDDDDDDDEGDTDLPVEATRIEMNPMAQLAELDAVVRKTGPQPLVAPPRQPTPPRPAPATTPPPRQATPPRMATPQFGMPSPGGSMFGGPPGGLKAPPVPPAPEPTPEPPRKEIPSIFGGPSKIAPKPAAAAQMAALAKASPLPSPTPAPSPRAKSITEPAVIPGRSFGPAVVPTVLAEPEPTPSASSKSFASAPEAKTMAMLDGGFVAGALAGIRDAEKKASAVPAADGDGPTLMEPAMLPPVPSSGLPPIPAPPPPARPAFGAPNMATMIAEPSTDFSRSETVPAMSAMASPADAAGQADAPTYRAPMVDPTVDPYHQAAYSQTTYPSGELLVPPNGTPPGTMPSSEMMLPAHLIGLPPVDAYPRYTGAPARRTPSWLLPVAVGSAIAIIVGVIAAIAG